MSVLEEEKICPVCGSEMEMLSPQSWTCKCGHEKKGNPPVEGKTGKEKGEKEIEAKRWEEKRKRIKKRASVRRKKGDGLKKKRGDGY